MLPRHSCLVSAPEGLSANIRADPDAKWFQVSAHAFFVSGHQRWGGGGDDVGAAGPPHLGGVRGCGGTLERKQLCSRVSMNSSIRLCSTYVSKKRIQPGKGGGRDAILGPWRDGHVCATTHRGHIADGVSWSTSLLSEYNEMRP